MHANDFTPGKLPQQYLASLLKTYTHLDARVVVGPQIGEDAAVIDMGSHYLIAKSDPITFATDQIGYYAVQVNANDIATRGGTPKWFLATILLPEQTTTAALVEEIFAQLSTACQALGITLIGGHTEITYGIDRPIVSGHMLGEVAKDQLITTAGAQPGDAVFLSKGICVEGTAIIAREKFEDLLARGFSRSFLLRAQQFLFTPGIGVVQDAQTARKSAPIHAMHDPTEGGLAEGLHELAIAADVGLVIEQERIPVFAETRILCQTYQINPLGMIASGALLFTAAPAYKDAILHAFARQHIPCAQIGLVVEKECGVILKDGGKEYALPHFAKDEILKIFTD